MHIKGICFSVKPWQWFVWKYAQLAINPLPLCAISILYGGRVVGCLVITVWVQRYWVFLIWSIIQTLMRSNLPPSWEGFIQNSLISCFINLEPQAEMFKAAGRPEHVVQGNRADKSERNYVCMFANTSSGAHTSTSFKVVWKVTNL